MIAIIILKLLIIIQFSYSPNMKISKKIIEPWPPFLWDDASVGDPWPGIFLTRWCPPSYKLVYNPNNYRYNPLINPSEIVLINQLNANDLGHHLVGIRHDLGKLQILLPSSKPQLLPTRTAEVPGWSPREICSSSVLDLPVARWREVSPGQKVHTVFLYFFFEV